MEPAIAVSVLAAVVELLAKRGQSWLTRAHKKAESTSPDLIVTGPGGVHFVVEVKEGSRVPRFGEVAQVEKIASEIGEREGLDYVTPILVTDQEVSPSVLKAAEQAGVEILVAKGDSDAIADKVASHLLNSSRQSSA